MDNILSLLGNTMDLLAARNETARPEQDLVTLTDQPLVAFYIRENTWLERGYGMDFGWGNGYVVVQPGHPWHGVDYDTLNSAQVDIHGGLTWSSQTDLGWEIGFDTCHSSDTLARWPQKAVLAETLNLVNQAVAATKLLN